MTRKSRAAVAAPPSIDLSHITEALRPFAVTIESLTPDPANVRLHNPRNIEAIKSSLRAFGQRKPIVVRTDGRIVEAGNGQLEAARQLGWTHIAAVFSDDDLVTAASYAIADNRTAELATWDDEPLARLLKSIEESNRFKMPDLGFSDGDLRDIINRLPDPSEFLGRTDPNEVPAPPKTPITKPGDLYILGEHRLLCGDSTSAEDVRRLMNGERAVLFSTDPPYLVDYDGKNHPQSFTKKKDGNKDWSDSYAVTWDDADANPELYDKFIATAIAEAIDPNAAWYCWHASRRQAMLEAVWIKHGAFVHQQIIWAKDRPILTRSWYMWQHEPCFMGWVKGKKPQRTADDSPRSVWNIPTIAPGTKTDHPTSKPVEVFAIPMRQHTRPGELCYEPFSGSGSQLIAAEQVHRRCFAMEISPQYCDVAVKRWETFTGKKARHEKTPAKPGSGKVAKA